MKRHITIGFDATSPDAPIITVPIEHALRHMLVMGKSGSGKSFLVASLICQLLTPPRSSCVTVVDYKGETIGIILRLLQILGEDAPITRNEILSFSLGADACLKLDPLVPVPGLHPATQSAMVVDLLSQLSDPFGPRMQAIARALVQCAILAGASLLDVRALLVDDRLAPVLASRVPDAELQTYLRHVYENEPNTSKDSLRARLDTLLALPTARAMLTCGSCIPASLFLESPLALLDLGGAGLGSKAIAGFIGGWIFTLVASAIYSRVPSPRLAHSTVVIDEWPRLVGGAGVADDLEDILATARSNNVSLVLANQYAAQISAVSPALWEGVKANVALEVLFRPDAADVRHVDRSLPVTGGAIDPARPDRLLTRAAERDLLHTQLANLPPRHALVIDHLSGEPGSIIRTPALPIDEATAAWDALGAEEQAAWYRGGFAVPSASLIPRRTLPIPGSPPARTTTVADSDLPDEGAAPAGRSRRPRLRILP